MKKYIYIITFAVLFLDQIIKQVVASNMALHNTISVIPSFFQITYVENFGGAWGIFGNSTWILAFISMIILTAFLYYIRKQEKISITTMISYGLFIGGLLGNLIDRLFRGCVIDYLDFFIFGYDYPVFNVADIAIVVAIGLLLIEMGKDEIHETRNRRRNKA